MRWPPLRPQRFLQPGWKCTAFQISNYQRQRNLSTTGIHLPNIASAHALHTNDEQDNIAIEVVGSVRTIRKQKHRAFLEIGDGSTVHNLQAVLNPDQAQGYDAHSLLDVWKSVTDKVDYLLELPSRFGVSGGLHPRTRSRAMSYMLKGSPS